MTAKRGVWARGVALESEGEGGRGGMMHGKAAIGAGCGASEQVRWWGTGHGAEGEWRRVVAGESVGDERARVRARGRDGRIQPYGCLRRGLEAWAGLCATSETARARGW